MKKNTLVLLAVVLILGVLFAAAQTNTFCANNLACTVTAPWSFTSPTVNGVSVPSPNYPSQIVFNTASASTNASISAVTMATASGSGNTYRFSLYIDQTVAGTSCSGTTTITPNLIFTDPNASSGFPTGLSNALIGGNGAPGYISGTIGAAWTFEFRAKASSVVQYSVTYSAGGSCAPGPSYQIYPVLVQLQ